MIPDHPEFMVLRSIIWIPKSSFPKDPTPAVRPSEWTLAVVGEPCLSVASWLALAYLASISCP